MELIFRRLRPDLSPFFSWTVMNGRTCSKALILLFYCVQLIACPNLPFVCLASDVFNCYFVSFAECSGVIVAVVVRISHLAFACLALCF